jgi:hypothetical protein|tara:strand:+ start:107 stop:496 length:390 start_codon:yes stop_codon:yes gene_type:complete
MAVHTGSEGTVKVGSNTIAEIRSFSIDETHDAIEKTAMGDSYRSFSTGLSSWSGSIECWWDETDTSGQGALDVGASVTLNLYPEGATTGDIYYSGTALISGKTISASADGMVEASYSVQGSGGLTESTA